MQPYLAFVQHIGETSNGEYIYRFDFTIDKDIVWGEFWNISPANLVPNIEPDEKCLFCRFKANLPYKMELACTNSCFSMQDCIDGIIALCFPDIYSGYLKTPDDQPMYFTFGEEQNSVINKLHACGISIYGEELVKLNENSEVESLANSDLTIENEGEEDEFDDYDEEDFDE